MTQSDFIQQVNRLAKGFGHQMTVERTEALFSRYCEHDADVFAQAVNELLCGPRWPYLSSIDSAVAKFEAIRIEEESRTNSAQDAGPVASAFSSGFRAPPSGRAARFYEEWDNAMSRAELRIPTNQYRHWESDQRKRFHHCRIDGDHAVL